MSWAELGILIPVRKSTAERVIAVRRCWPMIRIAAPLLTIGLFLPGCQTVGNVEANGFGAYHLAGTDWMLIEYGGDLTTQGKEVPPNRYTLSLEREGKAAFRLDCNYATTSWTAAQDGSDGDLSFGVIAATTAVCPDDLIGEQIARDMSKVTSYQIYDGRLTMTIGVEGVTYIWDRID